MSATLQQRLVSLLWLFPAALFSIAVMRAPSHARAPISHARSAIAPTTMTPIDPTTAQSVFEVLRSVSASESACTFDGVTTASTQMEAHWHQARVALPAAVIVREGVRLSASVPPELRSACPRVAGTLDRIGENVSASAALDVVEPGVHLWATIPLASARWMWIAIALTLAGVTRWVALALARSNGPSD